jgi:YD repeat-containing protein
MKRYHILIFALMALLSACNTNDEVLHPQYDEALEIKGIQVGITGAEAALTRAATVDPLKVSLGRTKFVANDSIVFTTIMRTDTPLDSFTYSNIHYVYNGSSWDRASNGTTKDPEKIYWTDGHNTHTFIGYCVPSGYQWQAVANSTGSDTYASELGYGKDAITYDSKDAIEKEDPLVLYSDSTKADAGGLTTTVYFNHALSGVRVVVNIKDFAASATSLDTLVTVSDFKLLNQPCKYTWGAHGMTDVTALDFGDGQTTKDITLWCPQPKGEGKAQSKTFTFYGLTTPQDATFHGVTANSDEYLQFQFTVKYPDADNTTTLTKTYTGKFSKLVNFQSGKCTTLNISLNHQNEQMFTKVTYDEWDFVATPDLGELRKKSTFMDIDSQVTIHSDANATIDDATWLYKDENKVVKDIYGNDGSAASPYLIKSASQLLSFAKEVKNNNTFGNKYVRLDADITMQKSSDKTSVEDTTSNVSAVSWIGIGDADHPFQGTFLGGDRYINRLYGSPLFVNLGAYACVEQLYITAIGEVSTGALAGTNAGIIGGCKVIDDVTFADGSTAGALVGTNSSTGTIHACYYTGEGNLIGTDSGTTKGCYQANQLTSLTNSALSTLVTTLNTNLTTWYSDISNSGKFKSKFQFTYTIGNYPTVQVAP